jgi:DNA helicase-2/ATP-dependent DNA helicase PcrA
MNGNPLDLALSKLTEIQRHPVDWDNGPLLVLAGPGSGKTQVLTCRIARLLDASRDQNFRVLALTFTNKAADEMKERVASFVPGLEERANIGTFHSFCGQVLRQHGVHLGIKPDFAIYALDDDRRAVFEDALRRGAAEGKPVGTDDIRYLGLIDRMKARLIEPRDAEARLSRFEDRAHIALAYQLYEDELRRVNALDFNSLIFEAHRLMTAFPAIASRYRRSHPYWLIDEFQDTNDAQYRLVRSMAGDGFRNVTAVADDDQIIYQWNGASFRQIQRYTADFSAALIQLPTNYRCPPAIVEAANRLVAYNVHRTTAKKPLVAGKTEHKFPPEQHIQLRSFGDEEQEAEGIAHEIAERGSAHWGQITVLARTRSLLERMHAALQRHQLPSVIAQRRDDFLSPELRWLVACLAQIVRPLDRRNMTVLIEAYNRIAEISVAVDQVFADAEATGRSYLITWLDTARKDSGSPADGILALLEALASEPSGARKIIEEILAAFERASEREEDSSDLAEDLSAFREISRDIGRHLGRNVPLDQFLQELQLRSKEPSPKPGTVTLMTIHAAQRQGI